MKKFLIFMLLVLLPSVALPEFTLFPNVDIFVEEGYWSTFPDTGSPYYTFIDGDTTAAEDFDYVQVDCGGDTVSAPILEVELDPRLLAPPRVVRGLSRGFIDFYIRCKTESGTAVDLFTAYYPDAGGPRPPLYLMPDITCPTSGFATFQLDTDAINAYWGSGVIKSPAILYMGIQCVDGTESVRISAAKMKIKQVKRHALGF